jgi:trans-2,3-dihydro-3-hydroxyanthranilate isomerase
MPAEPSHPYEILDVFTDTPLSGNPLAVFTEAESLPSRLMQRTARELNLSETVFLLPGDREAHAQVRIFTPAAELPFAGHPILGSAFVVGAREGLDTVRIRTGAGIVPVALTRDGEEIVFGEMEQPIPAIEPFNVVDELLGALGVQRSTLPVDTYTNGPRHVMVTLGDAEQVATLAPDMGALARLGPDLCVSCFARDGQGARVKTRVFCPGLGVAEDPATGSAAGPLALHLIRHGRIRFGETIELGQGAEIGRPSELRARVDGGPDAIERIVVGGSAVRVAHGQFRLQ